MKRLFYLTLLWFASNLLTAQEIPNIEGHYVIDHEKKAVILFFFQHRTFS